MYIHYHRVYDELTILQLSMWLDNPVDRAKNTKKKKQWIEHCTGIARSWVRVPFKPEFF